MSKSSKETIKAVRWNAVGGAHNHLDIKDVEYTDNDRAYINVNDTFDVRVVKTDEGIVVDIFSRVGDEAGGDSLGSTYAYDTETRSFVPK